VVEKWGKWGQEMGSVLDIDTKWGQKWGQFLILEMGSVLDIDT
jgi:hypothetical protein